jgi:hypothetical protein
MKKVLILAALAALVVPGTALATKPADGPQVQYILQGKLSGYDPVFGCVTIYVTGSNYRASALVGQALTFSFDENSKISLNGLATISDDDNGTVKITASKDIASLDLDATLQNTPVTQVIDLGP